MPNHPALAANRVAVVTGAASGIGLAASAKFAALGMKVCMADANARRARSRRRESPRERCGPGPRAILRRRRQQSRRRPAAEDLGLRRLRRSRRTDEQRRNRRRRRIVRRSGPLAAHPRRQSLGRDQWGAGFRSRHDQAGDGRGDRQHRLQAGHHLSARRHGLQCLESGGEGRDRGAGARIAQYRRLSRERASAHSGLHLHRHDRGVED